MIRIHVLLLASLLSIWGLTSCENSDTDKVNSYNLEVNLSQNEITAINGIISIKVSIKEFDQLAYLVINKINDTNNISEKYIKSNLSPEYIFEYITMIENIVKEGIEKGELSKGDPNVIASGIFGIACSSLIYKMRIDKKIEIEKLYHEIDSIYIKKLKK